MAGGNRCETGTRFRTSDNRVTTIRAMIWGAPRRLSSGAWQLKGPELPMPIADRLRGWGASPPAHGRSSLVQHLGQGFGGWQLVGAPYQVTTRIDDADFGRVIGKRGAAAAGAE
jgi:hypothetical protein